MSEIEIRQASAGDAKAICEISCEDLGYYCDEASVRSNLESLDIAREAVFAAVTDGRVVGFVHVGRYNSLYMEPVAAIFGLAVRYSYRHNGAGRRLVSAAEDWAVEHGIKLMRINSGISRTNAHGLYRNIGYDSEKVQIRFLKKL